MSSNDNDHDDDSPGLDAAYAVESPDDNRRLYARWADDYESGFIADSRYVYHHQVATIFMAGFADRNAPVLDVGCGTGIVGEQLRARGALVIDGIDISPEMLAKAGSKLENGEPGGRPVYRDLIEADLTGSIDIGSDRYAGIVSAGTFTHGHLGPDALSELIRVARPGCRFALGINAAHFEAHGFADRFRELRSEGLVSRYETVDAQVYRGADETDPDQMAKVAVFELKPDVAPSPSGDDS